MTTIELTTAARQMLERDILPFWMERMQDPRGGFYGRIDGNNVVHPDAPKGAILCARILWTFSAAYRVLGSEEYLVLATRAKRALLDDFFDPEQGGVYWSLTADGMPLDTKKQIYAIGFAIYGLSEYARATGDEEALAHAVKLFFDIENHSFDTVKNGYFEAFTREWGDIADMRLSDKDANERKTMNTHLHILEPYTNLYRIWPDQRLRAAIQNLVDIFLTKILDADTRRMHLFFNDDWQSMVPGTSYGHDIEASWLIHEAMNVVGNTSHDSETSDTPGPQVLAPWFQTLLTLDPLAEPRQWWEYAETVVGYLNIWQHTGNDEAMNKVMETWTFINDYLIDREAGEWYWSVTSDGTPLRTEDKAGFWKCPYHNSRMCLEIIERLSAV
ncbi:MAG: AGE family epimerase/isomerase [Bacteroidales bacterium]|nr:AGE family epimerase/isomerase [Bacteroidales bacterium]